MRDFVKGVLTLMELQAQLFVADLRECRQRGLVPGFFLLCGISLGMACFPMALAAVALLLIEAYKISYAAGFLIAAVIGAALSGLLITIGWFQVSKQLAVLQRSQQELVCNLRWMKKILERDRLTRSKENPKNTWRTKA